MADDENLAALLNRLEELERQVLALRTAVLVSSKLAMNGVLAAISPDREARERAIVEMNRSLDQLNGLLNPDPFAEEE